jgi:glycerol-3-phosphate dehydrogenase (NAD(P)+)
LQIGVIGAGSWGTTLANLLAKKGLNITLWAYEEELITSLAATQENTLYLPGIKLSSTIVPTGSLKDVCQGKDLILIVTPSQVVRHIMQQILPYLSPQQILINASKGIENKTLLTMSEVVREVLLLNDDQRLAVLSGPSFAREVSK